MDGKNNQSYARGIGYVLLATLGWSLSGLFVRFMPDLTGFEINCWRGFWTAVSIFFWLLIDYGPHGALKVFARVPWPALFLSAFFFAFGSTMYVTSLTLVSTAVISVIGATSPLFTGVMSPWMTGEKPSLLAWAAALIALFGMGVIAWDGFETGNWLGMAVCLLVPVSFAVQTVTLRRYRNVDMTPAICAGGMLAFFGAGFAGFALTEGGGFNVELKHVGLLALMAVVQLAIPLIFFTKGARSVPAITLSLIVMLDAVLNPLWPWIFVNEVPEKSAFIGGGIIIGAVLLSIFGNQFSRRASLTKAKAEAASSGAV
jgi:drug/metabolite transporter, DME family